MTDGARAWLAMSGFDSAYGARPLRRLVQREIGDRLAKAILAGEISDGDTVAGGHRGGPEGTHHGGLETTVRPDGGARRCPGSGLSVRRKD